MAVGLIILLLLTKTLTAPPKSDISSRPNPRLWPRKIMIPPNVNENNTFIAFTKNYRRIGSNLR